MIGGPESIPPEVLEPVRRQRDVDGRAGDRPVPEPALDGSRVVALVGERVAARVARRDDSSSAPDRVRSVALDQMRARGALDPFDVVGLKWSFQAMRPGRGGPGRLFEN
jgi:hypothetical protein